VTTVAFAAPRTARRPAPGHPVRPSMPGWRPRHAPATARAARHLGPVPAPHAGAHERTDTRRTSPVVRRRRLTLGLSAVGILVALALPWGGAGSHPLTAARPVLAGAALTPHTVYVVQPGDTMWGIAERLDPNSDPRAVVAALTAQVGADTLQPGEHLLLP